MTKVINFTALQAREIARALDDTVGFRPGRLASHRVSAGLVTPVADCLSMSGGGRVEVDERVLPLIETELQALIDVDKTYIDLGVDDAERYAGHRRSCQNALKKLRAA